jgi:hypothetical protein
MQVNIITHTNGKGFWSQEQRMVLINKIDIGYNSLKYYPDEPFYGELRAYFEPHGFTDGSWNVERIQGRYESCRIQHTCCS